MSEITNHIEGITGVSTANTDFIESAQRFAASKIPKELMLWAITETVPGEHGGNNSNQQITLPIKTDSLLFVRRDQFEAEQVSPEMRGFIGNSNSLSLATNTFPKYYIADGNRVIIKPDPDNTYTGHAQYVDYTKINEDSDLRNAVVYHSASSEFEKLASSKVSDWTDLVPPIAPSAPDFGSDLTIGAVAPVAPSSPSFTYTDVSVNDMVQPLISVTDMSSASGAPTYTKPVMSLSTLSSIGDLSISAVSPIAPSISAASVTITGTAPTYTSPVMSLTTFPSLTWTLPSLPVAPALVDNSLAFSSMSTAAPSYTSPVISLTTFPTITWSFPSVPVAPFTSAQTVGTVGNVPTFTPPVMGALDFTDTEDLITNEEDSEMLAARISEIQAKIGEFSAKLGETQARFNKENSVFQADVQKKIQEAQLSDGEENRKLQIYQSELQSYQGEVNKVISGNQGKVAEWQQRSAIDIQRYGSDIQNALNGFNEGNTKYQAELQVIIQSAQLDSQDESQKLQKYSSELQSYSSEVNSKITFNQGEIGEWQQQNALTVQKYGTDIQSELNKFNKENVEYQALLQKDIQDAQLTDSNEAKKIQKYSSEIQNYQGDINAEVEEFTNNFQKNIQVFQQENQAKLAQYQSDIQNELNEFNKENVAYQEDIQKKVQNLQKDLQVAIQSVQNDFNTRKSNLDKDTQISLQNAMQDFQQDVQEYQNKLQKYGAEVGAYQQDMNKEIQDFVNTLQKESQEYQSKVAVYGAELQKFQAEVGEKSAKVGLATQNAAYYSAEAKKYYEWANMEISSYIQNNSKMINQTIAAQAAQR